MEEGVVKCPNCGAVNPDGKNFCGDCGAALPAQRPPPSREGGFGLRKAVLLSVVVAVVLSSMTTYALVSYGLPALTPEHHGYIDLQITGRSLASGVTYHYLVYIDGKQKLDAPLTATSFFDENTIEVSWPRNEDPHRCVITVYFTGIEQTAYIWVGNGATSLSTFSIYPG